MPPIGDTPLFTDDNVAVYAGGDYLAHAGAAESEGVLVAMGNATFDKSPGGTFNVGVNGLGSGIVPTPGSTMLAVGGALTITSGTNLHVGAVVTGGGAVMTGGAISNSGTLETFGGAQAHDLGPAAVAPYASFGAQVAAVSAQLAALTPLTTSVAGNTVTFTGDGTASLQAFTVTAADLANVTTVEFTNILQGTPIAVTVTGAVPTSFSPNSFSYNGVHADATDSPLFPTISSTTLWNFAQATTLDFPGNSHIVGSIIAPVAATTTVTVSTNGRLYVGGNLDVSGPGSEQHNYPWNGNIAFDCRDEEPVSGSITIAKTLTPGSTLDSQPPAFTGLVNCTPVSGGGWGESWTVVPPNTVTIHDMPIGANCTITENSPAPPGALSWASPTLTVNGQPFTGTFVVPDPSAAVQIGITVTNTVLGTFTVQKVISDPASGYAGTRSFQVDWTCSSDGYVNGIVQPGTTSGSLTLTPGAAGASPVSGTTPLAFPAGTTCTVAEPSVTTEPGDFVSDGFAWDTPSISGPITIGANDAVQVITVTNTVTGTDTTTPGDDDESELAATGTTITPGALAGAGLTAVGAALVLVLSLRKRVRSRS